MAGPGCCRLGRNVCSAQLSWLSKTSANTEHDASLLPSSPTNKHVKYRLVHTRGGRLIKLEAVPHEGGSLPSCDRPRLQLQQQACKPQLANVK